MPNFKKKFLALATAAVMSLSISTGALAADNVSVEIDGNAVSFSDATPIIENGQTYVPFSAVFDAIGAQTSYEASTKTVTATKDGVSVSFMAGSSDVTYTDAAGAHTIKGSAPTFIKGSRTYVSVRFIAEVMGYNVGWSESEQKVIITDINALMTEYAGKFTILDKYVAYCNEYNQIPYSFSGDMNMEMSLTDGEELVPITIKGTMTGLTDAEKMDMDMNLKMDTDSLLKMAKESAGGDISSEDRQLLRDLRNMDIDLRFDLNTGKYYFTMPLINTLMEQDKNTWFEFDYNELLDMAGTGFTMSDLANLYKSNSFTSAMAEILKYMPVTSSEDAAALKGIMPLCEKYLGDSVFSKVSGGYQTKNSIKQSGMTFEYDLVFETDENDNVVAYSLDIATKDQYSSMKMSTATTKLNKSTASVTMDMGDLMKIVIDMNMNMKETTSRPQGKPAAGAKVVSYIDMIMSSFQNAQSVQNNVVQVETDEDVSATDEQSDSSEQASENESNGENTVEIDHNNGQSAV